MPHKLFSNTEKMAPKIVITFGVAVALATLVVFKARSAEKTEEREPMLIEQIIEKVEKSGCYRAIILPAVIDGRLGPTGKIEAGAPDYAVISGNEIAKFLGLLKKRKPCDGLELGLQYELTFLMENAPTSSDTVLMLRKVGGTWYLASIEEKFEMDEESSKWMSGHMLRMEKISL